MTAVQPTLGAGERALRDRARQVIPGGMYGHMNVAAFSAAHPQFMVSGNGATVVDADGREYLDLMCSWGPMILGHGHPTVTAAITEQLRHGDCLDGTSPVAVEYAELLVDTIPSADWALFCKNGSDAVTTCVTTARAATGRRKVLVARGAYHGAVPWCALRGEGITESDQAHLIHYEYNDLGSAEAAAAEAGDDLAAIVVCPMRHDVKRDQELVDPAFARGLRTLADRTGAVLVLDDVRCTHRLDLGGSWEPLGVRPDLAAYSKPLANGQPLGAVTGSDALRDAVGSIYVTGSFWTGAVPLAAGLATLTELRRGEALPVMERAGQRLRDGLAAQALTHGFGIHQSGPVQMPMLSFTGDENFRLATAWAEAAALRGVYLHPWHNWFLSAAHTDEVIDDILQRTDGAFAALR
ncbi:MULTISPECIES: aminotransferase class III-fold pyridoxal phosphate-dependent enzyme [Pseudonocardia]|uniref:Aminopentol aminotransferase n=2 Tax=Pseudonocardia TaxID=1847 RepID=A0A1Y2MIK3_PSEAH|nr:MULTISPECIES: aminotransferase class III-fold pyridoxal phosphate-dependent enzyme [Pseudonocardia]OSY34799.1 Aminopentol aminotransferase [Pseudonocardia autotrophica]TDN76936.1 glutamate-1-semialdehyde 2,1-aminomutase [Pseudonocardia autotrophica]BBG00940.1 glutamate-1-semialdehyde 2,1-aminomutase [Pseudonocardia autotrophica]GEC29058.1 glutamate-1-semialdehyde 2,1-aminomutase [Pseudonocardia saturnea]